MEEEFKSKLSQFEVEPDEKLLGSILQKTRRSSWQNIAVYLTSFVVCLLFLIPYGLFESRTSQHKSLVQNQENAKPTTTYLNQDSLHSDTSQKMFDGDNNQLLEESIKSSVSKSEQIGNHDKSMEATSLQDSNPKMSTAKENNPDSQNLNETTSRDFHTILNDKAGKQSIDAEDKVAIDTSQKHDQERNYPDPRLLSSYGFSGFIIDSVHLLPELTMVEKEQIPIVEAETKIDANSGRFSGYFKLTPTIGYNNIEPNIEDDQLISSEQKELFSLNRLGIKAEIGTEFAITDRWHLNVGVLLFHRRQEITIISKTADDENVSLQVIDNRVISISPEIITSNQELEHLLTNLGLTVGTSYLIQKSIFNNYFGIGAELHKGLTSSSIFRDNLETVEIPTLYSFSHIYYRLEFPNNTPFRFIIEPTIIKPLYIDENINAPFYIRPSQLGMTLGFNYKF